MKLTEAYSFIDQVYVLLDGLNFYQSFGRLVAGRYA
jgi:hypothetical protein